MIASSVTPRAAQSGASIPQIFCWWAWPMRWWPFYIFMLCRVPAALHRVVCHAPGVPLQVTGDDTSGPGRGDPGVQPRELRRRRVLMAASRGPIRFVMDHRIFKVPVLGWLFKLAKAIPIAPRRRPGGLMRRRSNAAAAVCREGDLLAIFPEAASRTTAPAGIQGRNHEDHGARRRRRRAGAGDSDGAHQPLGFVFQPDRKRRSMVRPFRRGLFNRVGLNVGVPVAPEKSSRSSYTPRWRNCSREQLPEAGPIRQRQAPAAFPLKYRIQIPTAPSKRSCQRRGDFSADRKPHCVHVHHLQRSACKS